MFGKNKNKKVGLCVMVVTAGLVLAALWAVLATPETALADPPEGKGKGGGNDPVCVTFPDPGSGAGVESDGLGDYCNNKKEKVEAIMTQDGHVNLHFNTETTYERKFYVGVDFPDVGIIPTEGWRFFVGVHDESFDMRAMEHGEVRPDVNLMINTKVPDDAPDGAKGENWWLIFDPDYTRWGLDYSASTHVTVTCTAVDETGRPYEWVVENKDNNNALSKAVLVIQTKVKNKSTFKEYGDEGVVVPVTVPPFTATVTLN